MPSGSSRCRTRFPSASRSEHVANVFDADMTRYLDWFSQGKAVPGEAILTPGEPERLSRATRGKSGVPLPDETWASIVATARSVGVNRDLLF